MLEIKLDKRNYKLFVDFASRTCDYMSLVFEKDSFDNNQYMFREEYFLISECLIKKNSVIVHPSTGSCFENAEILFFKLKPSVTSFLKRANNIYDWDGMSFPEELCFYRKNKVWFTCIYHERILHVHNETHDDLEFFKKNKIKFVCEN